jgi:hypothetical protein
MDQVRRFNPPPSFVKEGDARTSGYREVFGNYDITAFPRVFLSQILYN